MPAYVIARFDITDPEGAKTAYPRYVEEARGAYGATGAIFLVRGGQAHAVEGTARGRNVVIGFPTLAAGRQWYSSDSYQAAKVHRLAVAEGEMALTEGLGSELPKAGGGNGYWIGRYDVRDMEPYKLYIEAAAPAFEGHGARFLARGGATEALEGLARARNALIEFPTVRHALDCYNSDVYQAARLHRADVATAEIVIVEGA